MSLSLMPTTPIICMMATYIARTSITLMNTCWKSTRQIPMPAHPIMRVADMTRLMYTVPAVHMSAFPMAITSTTWLTATCIIHMGITVMITGLLA
jgi:hypothetical protein